MKKIVLLTLAVGLTVSAGAQKKWHYDSTKVEKLTEVVVSGVRAQSNAPYAIANIKKQTLDDHSKTGRELPFLFSQTPGVLAWSENGVGTGTTYMRIRGAGDSRINVTLDGVPLNSPEDQCVFWANMNSYGSLLGSVQIQRGVGTSTNGDGAFGGTVALQSAMPSLTKGLELSASYGSYNTLNIGGKFSTGALKLGVGKLVFDGAYHQTTTDGFIHGTSGRSGSHYGGLTWLKPGLRIAYKNIGNFERTGQAWNGVTAGTNDLSIMDGTYGENTGIKTYKDMWDKGLGQFNSLYEELSITPLEQKTAGNPYAYSMQRYKMADGTYWDKTTDNFWQNHNLLTVSGELSGHWTASATLHYTHGYGYYEEFRPMNKPKKFGINNAGVKKTDFVRKKGLRQDVGGLVGNINYRDERWDIIGGLSAQKFWGDHFGFVTYAADAALNERLAGCYKYYDSGAEKTDASTFVKAAYMLTEKLSVFADMQYRHVGYMTDGINDKFYEEESGYYNQPLDIDKKYDFLNPKAGFSWTTGAHRIYGSVALSHREPERNNFTDNGSYPAPKAESLMDYELGYTFNGGSFRFGVNAYYMDYTDQFVQTGLLSDIGENLTTNIKDSYRMGLELQLGYDLTPWLTFEANTALSVNKIKDFDEVVEDWDNGSQTIHYDNSTLAFSPSNITNAFLNLHHKGWQATWHTNYVSRLYLDNTKNEDRSLPAYSVSNVSASYTLRAKDRKPGCAFPFPRIKEIVLGLNANNIFNHRYAASGWVYSAIYESGGHGNDNRYYQIGFIPMAGFTMMGNVTLRF
jgi:iron complex outermembrane receptor protein